MYMQNYTLDLRGVFFPCLGTEDNSQSPIWPPKKYHLITDLKQNRLIYQPLSRKGARTHLQTSETQETHKNWAKNEYKSIF